MARKKTEEPASTAPPSGPTELTNELAAISLRILDLEDARTAKAKEFNTELKKLKKRQREVATEIKAGGTQLVMMFGGVKTSAPDPDDEIPETEH